jgi:hypothetical protein
MQSPPLATTLGDMMQANKPNHFVLNRRKFSFRRDRRSGRHSNRCWQQTLFGKRVAATKTYYPTYC